MKRRMIFVILALSIAITCSACEKKTEVDSIQKAEEMLSETDNEEKNSEVSEEAAAQSAQQVSEDITMNENDDNSADVPVILDTPPFQYYLSDKAETKEKHLLQLNLISDTPNEITDDDKWFMNNELTYNTYDVPNPFQNTAGNLPEGIADMCGDLIITSAFYDDSYIYCVYGTDFAEGYILNIYDAASMEIMYSLDFFNYSYSPEYVEEDYDYIEQKINWAAIKDDILYISNSHNTYAESSNNMNAYITAIDLADMSILWRTDALVSNAYNFQIIDDVIICGYGFTDEPDYLYQINISSGEVLDKIPLKSAASYIIKKDNVLYVRTYNMDYKFEIIS